MTFPAYSDTAAESYVLGHMTISDDAYRLGCARLTEADLTDGFTRRWFVALSSRAALPSASVRMIEAVRELAADDSTTSRNVGRLMVEFGALHRVPGVFRFYLRRVLECSQRRELASVARQLDSLSGDDTEHWLSDAEQRLRVIRDRTTSTHGPATIGDTLPDTIAAIDENRSARVVCTGLPEIDARIGGLCRGENVVVAGATGGGKTALALSIAIHNAKQQRAVLFFSMEMDRADLEKRVLAHECEIDLGAIFRGQHTAQQRRLMVDRSNMIASWKLSISDEPRLNIARMREICAEHQQSIGLDLIVCDYLQLLQPDNPRASLREQISQISRDLKLLAREFRAPVLTLCQLSREGAKNEEPQLWHLKESGSIENDADMVWFTYPSREPSADERRKGIAPAWLKCAKNRRGATGKMPLRFIKPYQQFTSDTPDFEASF